MRSALRRTSAGVINFFRVELVYRPVAATKEARNVDECCSQPMAVDVA